MRPIHFRWLLVGVFILLMTAGVATAQVPPSAVLNSFEVQRLVPSAEPIDHARLSAHFAALADQHAAEARRHTAMGRALTGNANRRIVPMSEHCTRLAAWNTQSAATLRQLANHHNDLAGGTTSPVPSGTTLFEAGAGAPAPTERELDVLAIRAIRPTEHAALQEYFEILAKHYTVRAIEHGVMAQAFRGTRVAQSAAHCDRQVTISRVAAREATAAAAVHREAATGRR